MTTDNATEYSRSCRANATVLYGAGWQMLGGLMDHFEVATLPDLECLVREGKMSERQALTLQGAMYMLELAQQEEGDASEADDRVKPFTSWHWVPVGTPLPATLVRCPGCGGVVQEAYIIDSRACRDGACVG